MFVCFRCGQSRAAPSPDLLRQIMAKAYGWGDDWRAGRLSDDDILARLFRLNQSRAAAGR